MTVKLEVETKTSLNGIKVGAYGELAAIRYNMKDLEHTAEPYHDRDTDPVCEESSVALQHERGTEDDERGTEDAADALEADSDTIELIEVEYV
jgi:hypothetical protein